MRTCCKSKPVYRLYNGEDLCRKHFLEYIERKVKRTVSKYKLIGRQEKLLVACSGGKDSTTALYLINKFNRNPNVEVEAFHIDEGIRGYSNQNTKSIKEYCKKHKIRLHETSLRKEFGYSVCYIRDALKERGIKLRSCAICGSLRRYLINIYARRLKATKVVTGHNLDDEAQSVVMNLFKNNIEVMKRLGPITGVVKDRKFVPRIKPLYFCAEKEVMLYSRLMKFSVLYAKCPCSVDAYRRQVGNVLDAFDERHPGTKHSIINTFLEILPKIKKDVQGKVKYCCICAEPSNKKLCRVCSIIDKIKKH